MTEDSWTLMQDVWQSQPVEGIKMSAEQVRNAMEKLNSKLRRRNLVGGAASITVLLAFSLFFAIFPNVVQRIGSALTVLGAGYLAYQFILVKSLTRAAPGNQAEASLSFYRLELQRQRDFHRGLWLWSRLLIIAPGPLVFMLGFAQSYPYLSKFIWAEVLVFVGLWVAAIPLNRRESRKYQRELDALESGTT